MMRRRRRIHGIADDTGSTLPLVLVYLLFAIALVIVGVSATSLYLERKQLFTLADGAALAAAEAWSAGGVRVGDDGEFAFDLDDAAVGSAVREYLADATSGGSGGGFDRLEVVRATSDDDRTATVTLRAVWHAPISTDLVPVDVPVEVTSTARSVFH